MTGTLMHLVETDEDKYYVLVDHTYTVQDGVAYVTSSKAGCAWKLKNGLADGPADLRGVDAQRLYDKWGTLENVSELLMEDFVEMNR